MYAPVVTRFNTYGVELHGAARAYADAILALPPMREWFAAGQAKPWSIAEYEAA
jgi:glutathione S-transferase